MRGSTFIVVAGLLLLPALPLSGQSPPPFSRLELLAAGAVDVGIGDLADFWRSRHGGLLRLSTPFYFGTAAAALQSSSYDALRPEQPDFRMRTATVEWNYTAPLIARARVFVGAHAGATAMNFIEQQTDNVDENEFLAGVQAGLSIPIAGGFGATVIGTRRRVYTRHPLRLTSVVIGLHYSRRTPGLLREVLE